MAETCAVAFGRYLRTLRERRGFSLDDVASLSRGFVDPVGKSYLSRCENGRVRLALSKMIPLSRVYEVPPEVLVERLELDMELDKVGAPDTGGRSFAELTESARQALIRGDLWHAYGTLRDAVNTAPTSDLMHGLRDHREQAMRAWINFATAAANLGRPSLALHELEYVRDSGGLAQNSLPLLLERLARTYRVLGQLPEARCSADQAIADGERLQLSGYLGYFYATRATIAAQSEDPDNAIALHKRAYQAHQLADQRHECARTLLNLAQVYFDLGRYASARRALAAAERIARPLNQNRIRALIRMLLGEMDERMGKPREAAAFWRDAAAIAKRLNDKTLRFQVEFRIFKQAIAAGDELTARGVERRLRRISPWIREPIEELGSFRAIIAGRQSERRKRVAKMQLGASS